MNLFKGSVLLCCVLLSLLASAQKTCTSNPTTISSDINFGSITWTASGGATATECNNMADGVSTFTGNVIVDLANNIKITISNNVTITGNFPITGGPGATLSVTGSNTLSVSGNLGDNDNNGVLYEVVDTDSRITVAGTLYGKNNNAFSGDGKISGGTLDVKNGSTCGSPCPVSGGFTNCTSGDGFCTTNNVLPVKIISFKGETTTEGIVLRWVTTMEEDFDMFVVQQSTDGIDFSNIGEVKGQQRNLYDIETNYTFSDQFPIAGISYYRLQSLDLDGSYEYSKIIAVRADNAQKKFIVYPNPAQQGKLELRFNFVPEAGDEITVTDAVGKTLFTISSENADLNTLNNELNSGAYIIIYKGAQFTSAARFVVK